MNKKERIIIMTKLAIYDKTHGEDDKRANGLFYRDYVYRRNFAFRFFALIGVLIPIAIYIVIMVLSEDMDFLGFDYIQFGINTAIIIAVVLGIYTFVGTRIATEEYTKIKSRLQEYFALIAKLEELDDKYDYKYDYEDF